MPEKILIADDEQTAVDILKSILEDKDYAVITAYDGEEAVKAVREQKPDLVILDVMMPKMNGYEVCEKIKKDPSTKDIPVIMLTAKDMGEDIEMALSKDANWYITKPYDAKYLLGKISSFLNK